MVNNNLKQLCNISFVILMLAFGFVTTSTAQNKKKTGKKKAIPTAATTPPTKTPTVSTPSTTPLTPKLTRSAATDDTPKNSGLILPTTPTLPTNKLPNNPPKNNTPSFDNPFAEKCPPKSSNSTNQFFCVGIAGGSDEATPEEIADVHRMIGRIFYGKRFVMVKLNAQTYSNQKDEALDKSCDFFIQTTYSSPYLKEGVSSNFTQILTSTVAAASNIPGATEAITKTTGATTTTAKNTEKTVSSTGKVIEIISKPFGGGKQEFKISYKFYRLNESSAFFSFEEKEKFEKTATEENAANAFSRLLKDTTGAIQRIIESPSEAKKIIDELDKEKKKKKN